MPFIADPQQWIPGITISGTNLSIPLSAIPELTPDEVTGPQADVRKLYWAMIDSLFRLIFDEPVENRPTKISVKKSTNEVGDRLTRSYTFIFELTKQDIEVIPE